MKIYNQSKTQELVDYDLEKGYLRNDKLFIAHHDAVGKVFAESQYNEMKAQGQVVLQVGDKFYKVIKEYANGGQDVEEIKDIPGKDAYDEFEDIQIYIPYTEEELLEIEKNKLRAWRSEYFKVIDRACWYDCLTAEQKVEVKQFRQELLDITNTMTKPQVPECVQNAIKE